jgi:hypothetical protein
MRRMTWLACASSASRLPGRGRRYAWVHDLQEREHQLGLRSARKRAATRRARSLERVDGDRAGAARDSLIAAGWPARDG